MTNKSLSAILSILCAGVSLGFFCVAQRIPMVRTFSEHTQETAMLQGIPSLALVGRSLLIATLLLAAFWLGYSAILSKKLRRDFIETAQQDALTYLPCCILLITLLRFNSLLTYYFEGLLLLADTSALFVLVIALFGVFELKRLQIAPVRHLQREFAVPSAMSPSSWKIAVGLFIVSLTVYAAVGFRLKTTNGPGGDEPHYLLITHSVVQDHDLQIGNNYKQRDYQVYYQGELDSHVSIAKDQTRYSIHPIGMPLLLVPAYAFKRGYSAPLFSMNMMAACLSVLLFYIAEALIGKRRIAFLLWGVLSFTPPLLFYSSQLYPETPSALFLAAALLLIHTQQRRQIWRAVVIGLLLAYLPWLQQRMILPAVLLWGYHLYRLRTLPARHSHIGIEAGVSTLFLAASGALMAGYYYALFGNPLPNAPYASVGIKQVFSFEIFLREGLLGLLFDQEAGLLIFAPYMIFAGAGWLMLLRKQRVLGLLLLVMTLSIYIPCAGFTLKWRGAWSPVARYMVALMPILLIPFGIGLQTLSRRFYWYLAAMLIFISVAWNVYFLLNPFSMLMRNNGQNQRFCDLSTIFDITRYFPSFTEHAQGNGLLVAVWLCGLALITFDLYQQGMKSRRHLPHKEPEFRQQLRNVMITFMGIIAFFCAWTFLRTQPEYSSTILGGQNAALRRFLAQQDAQVVLRRQFLPPDIVASADTRFVYVSRPVVARKGKTPPGFIISGPREFFPQGNYIAYYHLVLPQKPVNDDEDIVLLDVVAQRGTQVFAYKKISGHDISADNQEQEIAIPFELEEGTQGLETRVYFYGSTDITVTRILIEPERNK